MVEGADVILRASRSFAAPREFRAHKTILSLVSPVFKDMFDIPQPTSLTTPTEATIPVIDVDDTPQDLENFLRLIYPLGLPTSLTIRTLDAISPVFVLLDKYQVDCSSLRPLLVSPEFLKSDPVRVYSLACGWGFKEEADIAAPYIDSPDMLTSAREEDIQRMTGMEYHRILLLCKQRQLRGQEAIRSTRTPCSGCPHHKRFYAAFRSRLLENFNGDCSTFYDSGRCVARCFELAEDAEKIGGVAPCGTGRDSHLATFIDSLAARMSGSLY